MGLEAKKKCFKASDKVKLKSVCSDKETKEYGSFAFARVKVFRIIHEFMILRLTFHRKSASKS